MKILLYSLVLLILIHGNPPHYRPAVERTPEIQAWENLRFGAFVHFNDNAAVGIEISKNTDPSVFNPQQLDFDHMMSVLHEAGVRYAVLTTRHTSGFCLWDSEFTAFDVAASPFKKDVVRMFVDACRKHDIEPGLYYCLWGGKWKPWEWNTTIKSELEDKTPNEVIVGQLSELAENYGHIHTFWLDMKFWADSTLGTQQVYDLLKHKNPGTFVHFNQHVQDGAAIKYFPTDIINGEERVPPESGHDPRRTVDGEQYYLPFEYEITMQRCDHRSLKNGLMEGSAWFTYTDSRSYPVDSLYKYIKLSYDRGGSNVLLSTAPAPSGVYRKADADSIMKLGKMIWNQTN